jgi:hypothetical protein
MPPTTLEAIALLGWMEEDEAVDFLVNRCVFDPPVDQTRARQKWEEYHARVNALPRGCITAPTRKMLTPQEKNWERGFLDFVHRNGAQNVRSLVKVNLSDLVVHQKIVLTGRAELYKARLQSSQAWRETALPMQPEKFQSQVAFRNMGFRAEADIDIPDGEWFLLPSNCNGEFHLRPAPALRHVTVTMIDQDRMLLWAGYHRSYARAIMAQPEGREFPVLVALAENVVVAPIAGMETPFDRLVRGARPPFFADFFDDRLFIRVNLLRKRPRMQIRSEIVWLDHP